MQRYGAGEYTCGANALVLGMCRRRQRRREILGCAPFAKDLRAGRMTAKGRAKLVADVRAVGLLCFGAGQMVRYTARPVGGRERGLWAVYSVRQM
jgi:hypothetical protein